MTYFEQCAEHVANHAHYLANKVREGKLNAGAFEGLIESFLDQPAYYAEHREKLKSIAMRWL